MKVISKMVEQQRLELASRFIRQQANELWRQLSIELGGQLPRNFQEAEGSHRSPRQVESRYLPLHRREEGTSTNYNGEHSNPVRPMASQRVYANTNLVTQTRVYNKPLPLTGGTGDTISPPLGVGIN